MTVHDHNIYFVLFFCNEIYDLSSERKWDERFPHKYLLPLLSTTTVYQLTKTFEMSGYINNRSANIVILAPSPQPPPRRQFNEHRPCNPEEPTKQPRLSLGDDWIPRSLEENPPMLPTSKFRWLAPDLQVQSTMAMRGNQLGAYARAVGKKDSFTRRCHTRDWYGFFDQDQTFSAQLNRLEA